ncbi:MAG: GFA family protein [Gammaproteobacteria bacterium]
MQTGSCHCGNVKFEVDSPVEWGLSCNCSICHRRGSVLAFVPRDKLRLLSPEDATIVYTFNHHAIKHRFCPTCGIHVYGEGQDPKTGAAMAAINLRCLDDFDLDAIEMKQFDGRSL